MKPLKRRIQNAAVTAAACMLLAALCFPSDAYALTGGYMCGYDEEHTHSEGCYDTVLVCGKEEHLPLCGITEEHLHDLSCVRTSTYLACPFAETAHTQWCYDEQGCLICGAEEHVHSEDCYVTEEYLACGKGEHMHGSECYPRDENGNPYEIHVHTPACWQRRCVCGKKEHKHDPVICMFASFDGVENAAVWESTVPFSKLTGDWGEDVLTVASSQIGYTENFYNSVIAEDGKTRLGYTRYGHWFGYPYGDWCAMFGAFCLNYAGVPQSEVPYAAGVETWIQLLQKKNMLEDASTYVPKPGDLIFIADDGTIPNHMGIVSSYAKTGDGTGLAQVIQGNKEDAVRLVELAVPHWTVVGYVDMEKAHDKWLGICNVEVMCGEDAVKLKYLPGSGIDGSENITANRLLPESDGYKKAMNLAERYVKKIYSGTEKPDIRLYELSGERNGAPVNVPAPDKTALVYGASGGAAAAFKAADKTVIMLCG